MSNRKSSKSKHHIKRREKRNVLSDKKATVVVSRNGATVQIDGVPAGNSVEVLEALLDRFRELAADYEELVVDLAPVPGGQPVGANDADEPWGKRRKPRVGFTAR